MDYYILKSDFNWADEMNLEGFIIINEIQKENFRKAFEGYKTLDSDYFNFYCGTNEEVELSIDDLNSELDGAELISRNEVKMMLKIFGIYDSLEELDEQDFIFSFGHSILKYFLDNNDMEVLTNADTDPTNYRGGTLFYKGRVVFNETCAYDFKQILIEIHDECQKENNNAFTTIFTELELYYDHKANRFYNDFDDESDEGAMAEQFPSILDFTYNKDTNSFECGDWSFIIND